MADREDADLYFGHPGFATPEQEAEREQEEREQDEPPTQMDEGVFV